MNVMIGVTYSTYLVSYITVARVLGSILHSHQNKALQQISKSFHLFLLRLFIFVDQQTVSIKHQMLLSQNSFVFNFHAITYL